MTRISDSFVVINPLCINYQIRTWISSPGESIDLSHQRFERFIGNLKTLSHTSYMKSMNIRGRISETMHKSIKQRYQFNCWEKNTSEENEGYPENDQVAVILRSMRLESYSVHNWNFSIGSQGQVNQ